MQTTLLGLAIAIILALVAALVGPLLIDWGGHRSLFEAEATRLVGLEVRVTGAIDARLLPAPRLTLHDIEIGRSGDEKIRARSLGIEFALGSLMRGEWRASELHLAGPQLKIGLDAAGHLQAPNLAIGFNPDALTIDRLSIEDGKLTLSDAANDGSVTLDHLWFNGEARSLLGPLKGEGAATLGGDLYPFRIAAGRYGDEGKLKLHVNVDPINYPLSIEADGALAVSGNQPRFDGNLSMTRPVGIALRGAAALRQPWRVNGKIKVTPASALMQDFEFQYGSEDKGINLTGVADFKFGKRPRFDGVLSGRQIDLDRALADGDGARLPPAAAIRKLAELAGGAFRPQIPIQIGIGIDQATLGGDAVQNLRGDISTAAGGWNLDRFEFRAPGFTQVRVSGHLAVDDDRIAFAGPAEIKTNDAKALTAWLEGRPAAGRGDVRPLSLRGELTLGSDKIAVERLTAEFDRKSIAGNFAYVFAAAGRPARLDAALKAPDLDIDAALAFGNALLAGSDVARPRDMTIAADIGHATIAGLDARDASARLKVDGGGLQIDRLSVADLGGAAFSASGRIDTGGGAPHGALAVDLETQRTAGIASLLKKFAPKSAMAVADVIARAERVKLHGALEVAADKDDSAKTLARLAVTGDIDAMHLDSRARMTGDWARPAAAELRFDATVDAPDGAKLLGIIGLDRILAAGAGPGQLKVLVAGPADKELTFDLGLRSGALAAQSTGRGTYSLERGVTLTSTIDVARADLRPLRPPGSAEALPFSVNARVAIANGKVSADDIVARLGAASVQGRLTIDGASPRRIDGALETDTADIAALIAGAIGMPPAPDNKTAAWTWSGEPFGAGLMGDYAGKVAFKARRIALLPQLAAREFSTMVNFGKDMFALDDVAGDVAGGRLTGSLAYQAAPDGLHARGKFALAGADVSALLAAGARPPLTGTLALSGALQGAGLSPVALIGSLHGAGNVTLSGAHFAGLDPRAFDAVTRAVDRGLAIDPARVSDVVSKALQSGRLAVKRAHGDLAVSAGQVRLTNFSADITEAQLSIAGNLDLTGGMIDGRLVLSGASEQAGSRPDIFMALKGALMAPERTIDVSALTGWLTLRSIENQAKQLRAIEQAPASAPLPRPKSEAPPAPPASGIRKNEAAVAPAAKRAPALPAPVEVAPLPVPGGAPQPETSAVHPQR